MAERITSNEREVQWSDLPSPPVEKIYGFLSRAEQVNMSLVCRKWSEGYGSPAVWKTFRFVLREAQLLMDICPVMKFVHKYSSMFQHVEIEYIHTEEIHLVYTWCKHLIAFLHILTSKSQLISVKFRGFLKFFHRIDTATFNDIYRGIDVFLGSQHRLKRAEFHQSFFGYEECIGILKSLTESNRESLTHLVLRRLVRPEYEEQESNVAKILSIVLGIPILTTLEFDYSFIVQYMFASQSADVKFLKSCETRVISNIILHYDDEIIEIEHFRGLTSIDWRLLKELYPNLQVECNFKIDRAIRQEVEFLIVPNMPITQLNFTSKYRLELSNGADYHMDIDELLSHFLACKTNDHLASLHLTWTKPIQVSTLIPFLLACSKLKVLQLFLVHPADGIILLMESWLENRPESLKKVLIKISDIENDDDYTILMNFTTKCVPLLDLMGLNVKVEIIRGSLSDFFASVRRAY
ncbi:hypothetical protein AVEN_38048-1 [Araneus ventricosus]|uniref:F-box domain-containing protein n=1 Tax=Araneus ventricosus TaxID=182803 RepID=A0A4Y2QSA9_ARAVE|nr:hypothetical protein AVEN_38048-1 [Araneus ventricosus]